MPILNECSSNCPPSPLLLLSSVQKREAYFWELAAVVLCVYRILNQSGEPVECSLLQGKQMHTLILTQNEVLSKRGGR